MCIINCFKPDSHYDTHDTNTNPDIELVTKVQDGKLVNAMKILPNYSCFFAIFF